eukprot:CAMPEP_0171574862 /NCGR_PEP_ID=MMETSP0961-20121227/5646_1 /TAXON_ID=87120 /ORGANISM="Aurantiochytrium limacinum, Strain ATCCMYA-1381" /LENGTH=399 /DNA_ID=CAMNT_0012130331 /DNA_START=124 /DNA_END=1320 /DNA_ORIENTATION=+
MTKVTRIIDIKEDTTEVDLGGDNIGTEGAKTVAKALERCKNLIYLSLWGSNIGVEGAKSIAKSLEGCKNLVELDLWGNGIGSEGTKAVAKALEGCPNLTHLYLGENNIYVDGVKALAKSLHKSCPFVRIDFGGSPFGNFSLTPRELFARVCSRGEDIDSSDAAARDGALQKTCLVCMEEHPPSDGTSCERGHFLCRDCVARSVEAATHPLSAVAIADDGTMSCMEPGCTGTITGQEITRLAPSALDYLLLIAKMRAESEASARAEQEIQRRTSEVLQVDGLTRDVRRHLLHIQEDILNLCCPNCKACFEQFNGSCAVKCGSDTCGHHFCAWCLEYSSESSDACHCHVRTCSRKLGEDPYFPDSFEQVRQAWQIVRTERLRKYWNVNVRDRNVRRVLKEQ